MSRSIPEHLVDEIRGRCDIVQIVGERVRLKKTGRNLAGLCPFHQEKTPSFTVAPDKQMYYCFGCGSGGDVFRFLMQAENIPFPEAVRSLAERAGVSIPERDGEPEAVRRERESLYHVMETACRYFEKTLRGPQGESGRGYLKGRGIDSDTAGVFRLGFATEAWDAMTRALLSEGFGDDLLVRAGLAIRREGGRTGVRPGTADLFRGRVMFPIADSRGRVIGFGGRTIASGAEQGHGPKYLNSPETPLFTKGRQLYAFHTAREWIRKAGRVVVMEGYTDVISAHRQGFKETVASLGTALTVVQGKQLAALGVPIILVYDGDVAGRQATLRGIETLLETGGDLRVGVLPPGCDPDQFLRERGSGVFASEVLDTSLSLFSYLKRVMRGRFDLKLPDGRAGYVTEMVTWLARVPGALAREAYAAEIAEEAGFRLETVLHEVDKTARSGPSRRSSMDSPPKKRNNTIHVKTYSEHCESDRHEISEKELLALILEDPGILESIPGTMSSELFTGVRKIVADEIMEARGEAASTRLAGRFTEPEAQRLLAELSCRAGNITDGEREREKLLQDCLRDLREIRPERERIKGVQKHLSRIGTQQGPGSEDGDEQLRTLLTELQGAWTRLKVNRRT